MDNAARMSDSDIRFSGYVIVRESGRSSKPQLLQ
jgi:hypothetical protein